MGDPTSYYSMGKGTAAIFQGGVQYSTGVATGYLIDQVFTLLDGQLDPEGSPWKKTLLMVAQAGVTGLAMSIVIPYIHENGGSTYQDPTGGYLLAIGLFHGQPKFSTRSKAVIGSLIEVVEEVADPKNTRVDQDSE